jgi:hypothetical protein
MTLITVVVDEDIIAKALTEETQLSSEKQI